MEVKFYFNHSVLKSLWVPTRNIFLQTPSRHIYLISIAAQYAVERCLDHNKKKKQKFKLEVDKIPPKSNKLAPACDLLSFISQWVYSYLIDKDWGDMWCIFSMHHCPHFLMHGWVEVFCSIIKCGQTGIAAFCSPLLFHCCDTLQQKQNPTVLWMHGKMHTERQFYIQKLEIFRCPYMKWSASFSNCFISVLY